MPQLRFDPVQMSANEAALRHEVRAFLAHELAQAFKLDEQINKLYSKLTTRELQVLERIVSGRLNKQIADDLNISIKTVEAHRANIMDKLQVTTVADLLKIALRKSPELAQP